MAAIRKKYPLLPVIMFSTLTQRGTAQTIDALTLGANDYVTKPANVGSVTEALQSLREQLIPKIKLLCARVHGADSAAPPAQASLPRLSPRRQTGTQLSRVEIVAMGASTGGPNALANLLSQLPGDLPAPVVIVQHMPPVFTRLLAKRLRAHSALDIREAEHGDTLLPGHVYIAPGGYHMVVKREGVATQIQLTQDPPENSCRPAVDVLFRSVADTYGAAVLAVILTGMGHDGMRGCERIRDAGGGILAQDEASSVVWGMPGFVVRASLADRVLPLEAIAGEIVRCVRRDQRQI